MRWPLTFLAAAALVLGPAAGAWAQAPPAPDRVEEDWALVVETPDFDAVGPQITTCMSPVSDGSTPFVAFNLNYRQYPSFSPGGMQIQVWSGQDLLSTNTHRQAQLNTPNETITWTQSMAASGCQITYSIKSGQSTTWNQFGSSRWTVSFPSTLAALDGYSPDTSVAKSGVTWQSDHVTSLKLVQVRYYANGNLISTDNTVRSVSLN
jgi:hypothetical protein